MEDSPLRAGKITRCIYWLYSKCFYVLPILISNYKFRHSFFLPFYQQHNCKNNKIEGKIVVYMALKETSFSGGLSDRLRAICAVYKECKKQKLPFKIVFDPLHLEDYLQPVKLSGGSYICDWRIKKEDLSFDVHEVYPCTLLTYHSSTRNRYQHFVQSLILKCFLRKSYKQIHIYSNMICKDEEYGQLFRKLFKPSEDLQKQIDYHLSQIGGRKTYISCTFRFRQLLGDFEEGGLVLPKDGRENYIHRCLDTLKKLHGLYSDKRILVTSDSSTFLEFANKFPFVYVIPGNVVHIGFTFDASKQTYMKSFIDYFLLSYADKVYLVRDKYMYHSGFPLRAALLHQTDYREINLEN